MTHSQIDQSGNRGLEMYLSKELSKLSLDRPFQEDEFVSILIYVAGPSRKAVVTDQDVLTKDELKKYHAE
eukprot:9110279-Pyramimonas_sp.AAC.1